MDHLFDFGISQEDALTENKLLNLMPSDQLLCITSAGDVPLNLLALNNIKVTSIDISTNQNALLRLKLNAVLKLEPKEAAGFLGYIRQSDDMRIKLYKQVSANLNENDQLFWTSNIHAIKKGAINAARFEKYIRKFNGIALALIGKKKLLKLFEFDDTDAQLQYFEKHIKTLLLKNLFELVFHPRLYKNRGISSRGLIHSGADDMAGFFFLKFRDFCCATNARRNYFLQYTFFDEVLFSEALPEYLTAEGAQNIRKNHSNLEIITGSVFHFIENCPGQMYRRFHLSNIGDWAGEKEFSELLHNICIKSGPKGIISSRYIHCLHPVPHTLEKAIVQDLLRGRELEKTDRYPFYHIVPYYIEKPILQQYG